jgi:polysaccharide biosynthesis protein PslH
MEARLLRILLLAPFAPRHDADHGGGRALAALLDQLAARHQVGLLYARAAHEPALDAGLRRACTFTEEFVRPLPEPASIKGWRRRALLACGLARGMPTLATDWWMPGLAQRLQGLLATWRPNILQAEFTLMAQYLPSSGVPRRVLTVHDLGAAGARQRWRLSRGPARVVEQLELRAWERFERSALQRAQAVVVFTEEDRQALAPLAGVTPLVRIPLGVAAPAVPLSPVGYAPLRVLFVGSFAHGPNRDAAERLMRAIWPRVRAMRPGARLVVIGAQPPEQLRRLAGPDVELTGHVADVTPYLDAAAVVVAPLRLGGGMRVKILEALAAGKAIVASPLAIAGLEVRSGNQLLLAESDDDFAAAIIALLDSPARRAALARHAYAYARTSLSWEHSADRYDALYTHLLACPHDANAERLRIA